MARAQPGRTAFRNPRPRAPSGIAEELAAAARALARSVARLRFGPPVTHVYNPLVYARPGHEAYVGRYAATRKRVVFLGMNPGPFGMAQTGVPFGAVAPVRDWLRIEEHPSRPRREHPRRPVAGFQCPRNEVSGERLWGAIRAHWRTPRRFFAKHYIANYCPLLFLEASGRNRTPDKLPAREQAPLFAACDRHLVRLVEGLEPEWVIGIGAFAEARARAALEGRGLRIGRILHPSPANPKAQRDWAGIVAGELASLGVCETAC
jgi:single-strand selective monofunctional uracil DNA glycosylase